MSDRLEGLGDFEVDARSPVASLAARARRRKRAKLGWAGVASAAIATVGALTLTGGGTTNDVSTTGEDGTPTTQEQGKVVVPSLLGATVIDATDTADGLGLRAEVNKGDADLAGALVIAQAPPAGQPVVLGSVIGLRTALPDTTEAQECPGTSHPHERPESADGLPLVEQVERGVADSAQNQGSAAEGQRLVLGMWNRYAYELDNAGEPTIERVDGFQLMALYYTVDDCPHSRPAFISGAPLTRVVLDRTDFQTPTDRSAGSEEPDGAWSSATAPPIDVRSSMAAAWTGTEVLVVGGVDIREGAGPDGRIDGTLGDDSGAGTPIHEARSASAAAYTPATDQWRLLPDMPFIPSAVQATAWTGTELLMLVHEEVEK